MLIASAVFITITVYFILDLKRWMKNIHPTQMTNEQRLFHIVVKK